jgi:hypothetical protein
MAGCSSSNGAPGAATSTATSRPPSATTTTAGSSENLAGFCAHLPDFKTSVTRFRSDLGKAVYGQPLDFGAVGAKARHIAMLGRRMVPPSDIAGPFRTALGAIATSAAATKPGGSVSDAVTPLFTDAANRAFDAVDKYGAPNCPAAG